MKKFLLFLTLALPVLLFAQSADDLIMQQQKPGGTGSIQRNISIGTSGQALTSQGTGGLPPLMTSIANSVFGRTGAVVADASDYALYYAQLTAANSFTAVNTFAGSFIFTPATITVVANAGTIDITKNRSAATNGANLTLTPSAAGTSGQQIGVVVTNSSGSAITVTGAGTASTISYTAPANSPILTYWQSTGVAWTLVGGAPTINDLGTITPVTSDLVSFWDVSGGVTGKATLATILALGGGTGANPTASVGLSAVNGVATTFLRSDGAPALDQSIAPTWTGRHIFTTPVTTGTGTTAGLQITANSLTTGNGLDVSSSSVTTGNVVSIAATGTVAGSNTKTALKVATSGANGTTTQTTYGAQFTNTSTGTSSTNYGLSATASGGTTNVGILTVGGFDLGTAGVRITDDGDGAMTWLGQGNGTDEDLTWNLDDTSNTVSVSSSTGVTTLALGGIGVTTTGTNSIGPLVDSVDGSTPLNNQIEAFGAGTAYSFTNSAAAIDFGTTDPSITLTNAGTYTIYAQVHVAYAAATVVAETATITVRRTNNTAANLGQSIVIDLPVATTLTYSYGTVTLPPFTYTTSATSDILTINANVSATLGAGTINATAVGTSIIAVRRY